MMLFLADMVFCSKGYETKIIKHHIVFRLSVVEFYLLRVYFVNRLTCVYIERFLNIFEFIYIIEYIVVFNFSLTWCRSRQTWSFSVRVI